MPVVTVSGIDMKSGMGDCTGTAGDTVIYETGKIVEVAANMENEIVIIVVARIAIIVTHISHEIRGFQVIKGSYGENMLGAGSFRDLKSEVAVIVRDTVNLAAPYVGAVIVVRGIQYCDFSSRIDIVNDHITIALGPEVNSYVLAVIISRVIALIGPDLYVGTVVVTAGVIIGVRRQRESRHDRRHQYHL